ncbi:SDR family oxidoreductase [Paludibaculum fermentans]|uniref:SDR family oxidoreductase n=1 Tax=Paludibaculum fermentans TaxID=1473598 RepID=A0A7S7NSW4_PALFE|nr:SDR family oxidoreductase [Paludibaculum fermentans]QOY89096.1 SDR family oxidoreductase [Paludibaculum fermentans]
MTLNLKGKTALVTGGSRGIGRAVVERLLAAEANVAFCGRSQEGVDKALEEIRGANSTFALKVAGRVADVGSEEQVRSLFEWLDVEFGVLDILVNNAGVGIFKDLAAMAPEEWQTVIGTNLTGVYNCCHHGLPRLQKQGGGWIVNIASLAGKNAFAGGAAYNASKFGLCGMSEAILLDHRYEGVKVTTVLPGSVSTDFGRAGKADWKIGAEDVAEAVAMILAMPDRTLVSHVEIRPSRPPRK